MLLVYDFIVEYKIGKEKKMADALSWKDELNEVDQDHPLALVWMGANGRIVV
jgi:hypothetical protein